MSVITPVRNGARYIARAVESILTQTLGEIEMIVVVDGSTDETPAILAGYARRDARLRVVHQEAAGISAASNHGIAEARAELLASLDADDMAFPDRLARQVKWLADRPEIAVLGGFIVGIDSNDRKLGLSRYPTDPGAVRAMLSAGSPHASPTVMMRKRIVLEVGGYRSEFDTAQDYDLWLRIAEKAAAANLAEPVTYYRLHGDQATRRYGERQARLADLARVLARWRQEGRRDPVADGVGLAAAMDLAGVAMWPPDGYPAAA